VNTTDQTLSFPKTSVNWFARTGYLQGVFWIILVCLVSNLNDILMRLAGTRLPSMQISFFRFFFAFLTLIPFMIVRGKGAFMTAQPGFHLLRAILGFGAVAFWCTGVSKAPLTVVSTIALTVPIFVLPMAVLFLKENVGWQRTTATLAGFAGILVIIKGTAGENALLSSLYHLDNGSIFLIAAAILFALSDILNKKMVHQESPLTMLFYFAAGTSLFGAIPAAMVWTFPTTTELFYLFFLGAGGNLILYFLLKAFAATDVSALAPYRYVELIFATFFGYILFQEIPTEMTLLGAAVIVPSTFAIAYYETRQQAKKP
jgi:S-adenosylmethionine uptake transporter